MDEREHGRRDQVLQRAHGARPGTEFLLGWSPLRRATVGQSQVALATPVTREELTHAKTGGQPSHNF